MLAPEQIAALKYVVFNSPDSGTLGKQILGKLLEESEGLTKTVHFKFQSNFHGYTNTELQEAFDGLGKIRSSLGVTHFDALLKISGVSDVRLWCATGNGLWQCWLGRDGDTVNTILVTSADLDLIDIEHPGLYCTEKRSAA